MSQNIAEDIALISKIDAVRQILEVVCRTTGLGFSAVARVTDQQWIACAVHDEIAFGLLPGGELQLETTICHEIRQSGHLVAIDHVDQDGSFCNHPTPALYGFQSYISVPIHLPDGRFFGTLCAIDPSPARVNTPETIGMFQLFADLIGRHLDSQERIVASEAALRSERETSKLRDQFIAVLGHDLRNPLAAIDAAVSVLRGMPGHEENVSIHDLIRRSSVRMADLINDVLDFARGSLGNGLSLILEPCPDLETTLQQVVVELQTSQPSRTIHSKFAIDRVIDCDSSRLAQMLSNLLANALTHGDQGSPIWVAGETNDGGFELSVTNQGTDIAPEVMAQLFEPFVRGTAQPGQQGLGLGL
ncbi:GAF domain-containing sensor histidine kinase, partial [bacterium]